VVTAPFFNFNACTSDILFKDQFEFPFAYDNVWGYQKTDYKLLIDKHPLFNNNT
jgi:hypothetical protein